ncbi:MAG TPA: aminotransferase class I/II-fold pyridoxal phosphate-dependent enzyme [Gaiellaceae bacterium]
MSTETRRINLSAPWIDERDEELVLEVLRSGWLSLGPTGPRFEALLADFVGAPHAAAVSSGTAGLHLCVRVAGVGPGDEVITSPYSFAASANCVIYEGATPVFADIDPHTYNLDPAAVEAAVTATSISAPAAQAPARCELPKAWRSRSAAARRFAS